MKATEIVINDRFRKDYGNIALLASSIEQIGLLHPPIVDVNNNLIDGERRILAMKSLGWEEIPVRVVNVPSLLHAENDANELAKQWTVSERVAIARAIESQLEGRVGNPGFSNSGKISGIAETGDSRDIAADKSGFGSGKTYEAAKRVIDNAAPQIVDALDAGSISINLASKVIDLPEEERHAVESADPEEMKDVAREVVKAHVANNSGNNEWYTPAEYINSARAVMGSIDTDPASSEIANATVKAAQIFTSETDGRDQVWNGRVWMNPPYSQPLISEFSEAVAEKIESGEIEQACVLVNNATETRWFQRMLQAATAVCFPSGRIRFVDPSGKPSGAPLQGQAIIYMGGRHEEFADEFCKFGFVMVRP